MMMEACDKEGSTPARANNVEVSSSLGFDLMAEDRSQQSNETQQSTSEPSLIICKKYPVNIQLVPHLAIRLLQVYKRKMDLFALDSMRSTKMTSIEVYAKLMVLSHLHIKDETCLGGYDMRYHSYQYRRTR